MKISIITPIYNEEKNLKRYFTAMEKIAYPRKDFEVIIVNDGSTDNTIIVLEEIKANSSLDIRVINFPKNKGISTACDTGVTESKYENIMLLGCKCEIHSNALSECQKINKNVIIGYAAQKGGHIFDYFFHLMRRAAFENYMSNDMPEITLTKENFKRTLKGTTIFFCERYCKTYDICNYREFWG